MLNIGRFQCRCTIKRSRGTNGAAGECGPRGMGSIWGPDEADHLTEIRIGEEDLEGMGPEAEDGGSITLSPMCDTIHPNDTQRWPRLRTSVR